MTYKISIEREAVSVQVSTDLLVPESVIWTRTVKLWKGQARSVKSETFFIKPSIDFHTLTANAWYDVI